MGLTIPNAVSTPGTKEPNADYEATKANETEFQHGFGSTDGSGRQQQQMDKMDTVQCNMASMVKKEKKRDQTCHIQGGVRNTVRAGGCNNIRRASVDTQEHSQWHCTHAETV